MVAGPKLALAGQHEPVMIERALQQSASAPESGATIEGKSMIRDIMGPASVRPETAVPNQSKGAQGVRFCCFAEEHRDRSSKENNRMTVLPVTPELEVVGGEIVDPLGKIVGEWMHRPSDPLGEVTFRGEKKRVSD